MPYRQKIDLLRQRNSGLAVYILDPPRQSLPFLWENGLGIFRILSAYRREHPHSAYLFDTRAPQESARRSHSLILPQGSLKKTQEYRGGSWTDIHSYCCKPHHWVKLGQHLTDLTAVPDFYPLQEAQESARDCDLIAIPLPPCPSALLCREFTDAEFAVRQLSVNPTPFVKARKQLRPFVREALQCCLSAPGDLYLRDERLGDLYPQALAQSLQEDHRKLDLSPADRACMKLSDPRDQVLLDAVPSPAIAVCPTPEDIPDTAEWVMAGPQWYESLPQWRKAVLERPQRIYLFPYAQKAPGAHAELIRKDPAE